MKADVTAGSIVVELTRRNLQTLLAKLDGYPPSSACSIWKHAGAVVVVVTAVEDEAHYGDRSPGEMHPDTEAHIA